MNPANFANMPPQAMGSQPGPQPPGPNNVAHVHHFIIQSLQQQPPIQGWQSGVQIQYRENIIYQIFSQLRLLQSQLDLQYQLQLALRFEAKAFADSAERGVYEQICKKKLADIHEMRTKQSAGMQQQMNMQMNMPHQMQNMPPNASQGLGPAQFQQSPASLQQQQMMQLHGMPTQSMPPNVPMRQPQPNMSQVQPSAGPQFTPSAEDTQMSIQMANRMYSQTPPQRMEAIQNSLSTMDPKLRESLARQNVDPLAWFFRTQAMKRIMELKRSQSGLAANQPGGMMNGAPRPVPAQPMATPQPNFEPPFDHIFGQQQDGLRSQEAGQVVVPASNPQASLDQRIAARANAQQQMNMQNGANRGMQNVPVNQAQGQPFWNPQAAQRSVSQGGGINTDAATAAGQAPANVLQGQPGGLDNQITRTPSQQTGMPNLNKAAPPGQAPNMWSQRNPQMNQPKPPNPAMAVQAMDTQQRPPMFQNWPPQLQQHYRTLTEDQRRAFLMNMQKRNMDDQQRRLLQQNQMQAMQMANARAAMGESFPMSNQPSQPGMQTGPMSNQNMPAQKPSLQNSKTPQPLFPQPNAAMGIPSPQPPGPGQRPPPLTDEQVRQMDQRMFPARILSQTNQLAPPKEVKTWGQLKAWAAQNTPTLPPAISEKLKELQAMHYRAPNAMNATSQAPLAQMVSQPGNQAPITVAQMMSRINVPAPSIQDIQNCRAGLAPQHKNVTDDQIRAFLTKQRQQEIYKRMQAQQAQRAQQAQQAQNRSMADDVTKDAQPGPATAGHGQSDQKGPVKGTAQKAAGSTTNQSKSTKQSQKGNKRSSHDDVVEISDPNRANNPPKKDARSAAQASKQIDQNAQGDAKGAVNPTVPTGDAAGGRPTVLRNIPPEESDRRQARLKQLLAEVGQVQPPRRPIQLSPQAKAGMSQKLRELAPMVSRMDVSLPLFFRYNPDEDMAKQLIQMRNIVKAQYRDDQYNLVDHFTIGQADLDAAYNRIRQYMLYVMEKFGNKKNAPQTQAPPPPNQGKAPLNAANLQEHENLLKTERAQRPGANLKNHNRAPAAPTSEKPPPFPPPLGPQSPHGHPKYGPTTFDPNQLVLPQNKRQKRQPSAGSTPVPAHGTPLAKSPPMGPRQNSPAMPKAPMPQLSFKCGSSDCQSGQEGFATQPELEQHNADLHQPEEPIIDDPVEFALSAMRDALGLDENGKSKPLEASKMKQSLSAQSHASIKQEALTPMAQAGLPASSRLKTPQASSNARSPAPDSSKGKTAQGSATPLQETTPPSCDPWAGSCISAADIVSAWAPLADMNSMSFTELQKGLTPSSTISSGNEKSENSPRESDISENDLVKISLGVPTSEKDIIDENNWIPSEWFDDILHRDIESMNFGAPDPYLQDGALDIFAGIEDTQMVDIGPTTAGKGKKRDEQDFVSEEWLKVYAPEKLPAKKGR
ncbi:MAG: hypothetical protein Q9169_006577 [Polycauliona sp. 2 TL-2023]